MKKVRHPEAQWSVVAKMEKFNLFFLSALAIFPSFVSACGAEPHGEEIASSGNIIGFGFVGGVMSTLITVAIILAVLLLNKGSKR